YFFFFQAEDGIRDFHVTGVQTCALPIFLKIANLWTQDLLNLKQKIETISGETFNSCLLNLYHDGSEGMAWHSDGEKDLKKNGARSEERRVGKECRYEWGRDSERHKV